MPSDSAEIDLTSPPFDRLTGIHHLASKRSGRNPDGHVRHHLYAARDKATRSHVLVKLMSKPGVVYEQNLTNEMEALSALNRELPDSRYFPILLDHGRLGDSRVYLTMSLFDEFPLATAIGLERVSAKLVAYLRAAIEAARALTGAHALGIFHVDLNPMNILYRVEKGDPVIRIVDFESAYQLARHASGTPYNPPTTPGYSAPEVSGQRPDARADVFSLGAVVYTMLAGYAWTWTGEVGAAVAADAEIDPELKNVLATAVCADPERRYRSMRDFQSALAAYLERIWPGRL